MVEVIDPDGSRRLLQAKQFVALLKNLLSDI